MPLNVKQRGEHVATFRWIEVRLMETLARWVPTTPETEVKLSFGEHLWDCAQHADWLGKRTHELRLPLQHSLEPSRDYVAFLTELAATADTSKRVAGFYDCALPALGRRFRAYLGDVDQLLDGPTVRILERILFDIERMSRDGVALRKQVPAIAAVDAAWLDALRRRESALADIVVPRPDAGTASASAAPV